MSHAFIVHGEDQVDTLLELTEHLRQAGIAAKYVASDRPDPDAVDAAIDAASFAIVLISYEAMRSRDVKRDIERASQKGLQIIPVRADRTKLTGFIKTELGKSLSLTTDDMGAIVEAASRAYRQSCPVIAVMNMKGGVGKTTVTAQLAGSTQARKANRVLMIDFDPQYNLTQLFFPASEADEAAARDASVISLFEKSRLHQAGQSSPADQWGALSTEPFAPAPRDRIVHRVLTDDDGKGRLDIIFGQFEISKYAFSTDQTGLEAVRQNFLRTLDYYRGQYDLILLDTNPNATFLTRCALEAADRVVAPVHTDIYSLRGLRLLNRVIEDQTMTSKRPDLSVLFNAVERREQSDFEADTRNGAFDEKVGFALSSSILTAVLPRSRHFLVRVAEDDPPIRRLLTHHGRGGGLRHIRKALNELSMELDGLSDKVDIAAAA